MWTVLAVFWILFFGFQFRADKLAIEYIDPAWNNYGLPPGYVLDKPASPFDQFDGPSDTAPAAIRASAFEGLKSFVALGFGPPIIALAIGASFFWTLKGFSRRG